MVNQLSIERRVAIVAALVEGNSIRATCRLTGAAKGTVLKLLVDIGAACEAFHNSRVVNIRAQRLQLDEIWCFCYAKDRNIPDRMKDQPGVGSIWTWAALDADTKMMLGWLTGARSAECAHNFVLDLSGRLVGRPQVTTDSNSLYLNPIATCMGGDACVDYAMLQKLYGEEPRKEARYSPSVCKGIKRRVIHGNPDRAHISTSFIERANLTLRMQSRRFTRLTNAFSRKLVNLQAAVHLHYTHYNWCRVHQTLDMTPAMAANLTHRPMTLAELVGLLPG